MAEMVPLLTTAKIAPLFNVTPRTIQLWALRGWIQGKRIGKSWYFAPEAIEHVMELRGR